MSRFFEYLHQVAGPSEVVLDPKGLAANLDPNGQAGEVLSILYGRHEPADPNNKEPATELDKVRRENVRVDPKEHIVCYTEPRSPAADKFRLLRMRLREIGGPAKVKRLLVTSPLPHEGKTTVTMNLATALAEGGRHRVLVVDADFHQSNLNARFGLAAHDGLAECLTHGLDPVSAMCRIEPLGWYLLQTGETPANPTALLHDDTAFAPIRRLSQLFDWIIIDAPPVLPLTDAVSLRQQSDATLLVAKAGSTPVKAIRDSIALLGPKSVMGVILNGIEGQDELYTKYKGYYGAVESKGNSSAS